MCVRMYMHPFRDRYVYSSHDVMAYDIYTSSLLTDGPAVHSIGLATKSRLLHNIT